MKHAILLISCPDQKGITAAVTSYVFEHGGNIHDFAAVGEMKQIIVTVGQASSLRMNDKTLEEFAAIENVKSVLPVASVVSKINYNNSISDAIAYAVTREFLEESAIQPTKGELFEDGEISTSSRDQDSQGSKFT